jgi:hypothetical protein
LREKRIFLEGARVGERERNEMETDERFPSGPWIGFYQQGGLQSRQRLGLEFKNGRITDEGRDPAGHFLVSGTYQAEAGKCSLRKTYPTHTVEYDGNAEGDGIWGRWVIRFSMFVVDQGVFHIWPDARAAAEAESAKAAEPAGV